MKTRGIVNKKINNKNTWLFFLWCMRVCTIFNGPDFYTAAFVYFCLKSIMSKKLDDLNQVPYLRITQPLLDCLDFTSFENKEGMGSLYDRHRERVRSVDKLIGKWEFQNFIGYLCPYPWY
jgi:hypothetical protein